MNVKNSLISMTAIGLMIVGCGGGGGTATTGGGGGNFTDNSRLQGSTARVDVDLTTGETKVTPLGSNSRAVFGSGAISVSSAEVFRVTGGSTSARTLRLTFKNNSQVPFGNNGGLRFMIGAASPNLTASTEAGIGAGASTDGSVASAAVGSPSGVWEDNEGTMFISQGVQGAIRTVKNGSVSTLNSLYNSPRGITGQANGDFIYFCETGSHRIIRLRKDGNQGNVVAGTGVAGDVVGAGASARFNTPIGLTSDPVSGTLYVADYTNGKVKAIANPDTAPTVSTLATGIPTCLGIGFGTIEGRSLIVATSSSTGQVFLIDPSTGVKSVIRTLTPNLTGATIRENRVLVASSVNTVTVLKTGSGASPFEASSWQVEGTLGGAAGFADGVNAQFNAPQLMSSGTSNVFMCDSTNHRVRRLVLPNFLGGFSVQPAVFTNTEKFSASNQAIYELGFLSGGQETTSDVGFTVQFGASMTFFVTVFGGTDAVVPLDGAKDANAKNVFLRLLAGKPGESDIIDGVGGAARFQSGMNAIAATIDDHVFLNSGEALRVITPDGTVRTIANKEQRSGNPANGNGDTVVFGTADIRGLSVNRTGSFIVLTTFYNVFIGTRSGNITSPSAWTFSRIAGSTDLSSGDAVGDGNAARFSDIGACAFTEDERTIFVTEWNNHRVKKLEHQGGSLTDPANWKVTNFAGSGVFGFANGTGTSAQFANPQGIVIDRLGNLYVGEDQNSRIRKITVDAVVTTLVGDGTFVDSDANGTTDSPRFLAIDNSDSLYFGNNSRLRVYRNNQLYTVLIGAGYVADGFVENFPGPVRRIAVNRATGRLFFTTSDTVFSLDPLIP